MKYLESFFSKKKDDDIVEELIQQLKDPKNNLKNYSYSSYMPSMTKSESWKFGIGNYEFLVVLISFFDPFFSNSYSMYLEDKELEVSKRLIKKVISLAKKKSKNVEKIEDPDDFDIDPRRHFRSDNQIN
jgi:hypothetical protein